MIACEPLCNLTPRHPCRPRVLRVESLCKHYGSLEAVKSISFQVYLGESMWLLSANGTGKTTIVSMILRALALTVGSIHTDATDLVGHCSRTLSSTNFPAVYAPVPGDLFKRFL